MHILIGLLVVVAVAYFLYRASTAAGGAPAVAVQANSELAAEAATLDVAFVADGKLFYRTPGAPVMQLHSTHIEEALDRRERSRQKNAWKENTSFGIAAGGRMRQMSAADTPIAITSAAFDEHENTLLYVLKDESVGGLFSCRPGSGAEQRLLLKQQLHLDDLSLSPDGKMLAASSISGGIANIVVLNRDGSGLREATGGDSFDTAPAWLPGVENRLLFQSAGLARHASGQVIALGNATIQMLNMQSGTVSSVLEDARYDFINPRVCPKGNLLFIRRPYEPPQYGAGNVVLDTIFFPFRLVRAVFHYLNFFSLMYSRKPLTSASGPAVEADMKQIMLQGKRIDAEKLLRSPRTIHGVPSLVPQSWVLVSRTPAGVDTALATNVASYDIDARGRIVYSNGRGVFALGEQGKSALVLQSDLVADVFAARLQPQLAE
ncbi:hypothetical protein VVD49_12635 [Uliginosibacterium sp. H3]|uniref:WD40-like Beta Propeller Repeat n=1 Tax=Uliginosibacterium silvisoli TaxID=3114758 RepID=A0ABU6K4E8_9RHOO|nr:hypothetical protein [Uliginosibacterium sp. H3]